MAIPDPTVFRTNTAPPIHKFGLIKVGANYGGNLGKVLAALEAYWPNRNSADQTLQLGLLYNLWKQARIWLSLKAGKAPTPLFTTRVAQVTNLRNEALAELTIQSPQIAQILSDFQWKKATGPVYGNLQPLQPGYTLERQIYLKKNKTTGAVPSASILHQTLDKRDQGNILSPGETQAIKKIVGNKGFTQVTADQLQKLEALPVFNSAGSTVSYLNKIARLKYMVCADNAGLLCDMNNVPISMVVQGFRGYSLVPYAMDKYGNLFIYNKLNVSSGTNVLAKTAPNTYAATPTDFWNHSSFMAGKEVLCAGCIHIGYDAIAGALSAGVLTAIDNSSGHYKPTRAQLHQCVSVLDSEGVDLTNTRIGIMAAGGVDFVWGGAFLANVNTPTVWTSNTLPPLPAHAPPVENTAG